MPKTEDPLGPGFESRLRAALDRVPIPHGEPRYTSAAAGAVTRRAIGRALPVAAVALAGLLLTAYAATGTPNPLTWTQNAASAITTMTHAPEPAPPTQPANSAPAQARTPAGGEPGGEKEPAETGSEPAEPREPSLPPDSGRSGSAQDDK